MTGDVSPPQREERPADPWHLPTVISIEVKHANYDEPLRRYVTAREVAEFSEAIEFEVATDGELPIRALPAVMFVGEVMVNDYEQIDRQHYVFRAFEPDSLPPGAAISLGWPGRPDQTRETRFRYEPPLEGPGGSREPVSGPLLTR
jgi:hypothetical protein